MAPSTATTPAVYSYLVILRERGELGKTGEPMTKPDSWLAVIHFCGRSFMNKGLVSNLPNYVPAPNELYEHYQRYPECWHALRRS